MWKLFPCGLLLIGSACSSFRVAQQRPEDRPHVLVIVADDLGFKDVGYHGSEIRTPNLDELARAGMRLNQFYVQPVCSPTRAALMTGRYPIRLGLQVGVIRPWATYGLGLSERTLPQALKEVGYRTAIVGKWHLGLYERPYLPTQRGFDYHYGHYLGMIDYFTHEREGGLDWHRNGKAVREEGYTTNLMAREAERLIGEHDRSQPLFLYVAFNAPHTPLQAPEEYLKRYEHIKAPKRRKYAAMVTCMDDAIGRIVGALGDRGMRDDTLILFCSDNGGPLRNGADNGSLREGKGSLYEGGVRVPALAVWPGRLSAGTLVDGPMHIVDWYPTLLKLAGASLSQPFPLDGLDIWPTLAEGKPSPRIEILHNLTPDGGALRRGDWKLVVKKPRQQRSDKKKHRPRSQPAGQAKTIELFNIAADPEEKNCLTGEEPGKVQELMGRLDFYAERAVAPRQTTSGQHPADSKAPKVWGEFD